MAKDRDPKEIPSRITLSMDEDMREDIRDFWQLIGMDEEDWDALPHTQKLMLIAKRGIRGARKALEDSED